MRLKAMWGLPPDAHVDEDVWKSAIHPDDQLRVAEAVRGCLDPKGDRVYALEYRVIGIGNSVVRWVKTFGSTTFESGQPVGFVGVAMDISKSKHADEALRESEERFRRFAQYSSNVLWILDLETMQLDYLSPAFQQVWGEGPESILPDFERWIAMLHADDRARVLAGVQRVRAGASIVQDYQIVRPDGRVRRTGGRSDDFVSIISANA